MTAKQRIRSALPYMTSATLVVAIGAVVAKQLTGYLTLDVLIALRFLVPAVLVTVFWAWAMRGWNQQFRQGMQQGQWWRHLLRAVFVFVQQLCYLYYLYHANIFDATVLLNTSPVFMVLFSAIFLRVKMHAKTWACVAVSFVGILLIIKPDGKVFEWYALAGLAAGLLNAASQLTIHALVKQCDAKLSTWMMYALSALFALVVLGFKPSGFSAMAHINWLVWGLLIAMAVLSIINQLLRSKAYSKVNKGASLSSFIYLTIVFALILQVIFYGEWPDVWSFVGAALVVGAGLAMLL